MTNTRSTKNKINSYKFISISIEFYIYIYRILKISYVKFTNLLIH